MVGLKLTVRVRSKYAEARVLPRIDTAYYAIATVSAQGKQITAPGQASTVVSRPKIGEDSRVRAMRQNAVSIIKQRRPVTLGGTIDFHNQQCIRYYSSRCKNSRDIYKVCVRLATGIRKFLDTANYGSLRQYVIAGLT